MADRKKRIGIIVGIVVALLLLCALYWQVNRFKLAPSLYEDAEVMQGVTVSGSQLCNDTLEDYFKRITGGEGIA